MSQPEYIIFGATHIGIKLARLLVARAARVTVIDRHSQPEEPAKGWEYVSSDFAVPDSVKDASAVYVVTEQESLNIRIALAVRSVSAQVPVIITLQQSRLGRKLARHLERFSFISPSELAAKQFVDSLDAPSPGPAMHTAPQQSGDAEVTLPRRIDPLLLYAISAALTMAALATVYFHFAERLPWMDALYFVVTLMATVGFGDINLRESSDLSKVIGVLLMAASITNTAILFALVTDSLLRHRLALAFGRRRIKDRDHVVVVGMGAVGFQVVEELIRRKEKVVIVDNNPNGRFMPAIYAQGVRSVIGDARVERTLRDAGLTGARALMSVTSDDLTNLEIALNARSLTPHLRVVLRIFNP
ncbi:MAG TPA: NAD-binding protein, partial [Blastocatellia bacterium]